MTVPSHPTARPGRTLAVLSVAQFLIALDYSISYVALPSIAADLRLGPALAQWVISAYAVAFAGFLVVGGRLADRIGARRLFVLAVLAFGVASALGGVASDAPLLLAARGTQGVAAALVQPSVLGLIGATFPAGPARARALAVWGSVGASGLAAGAILGGLLTSASWRLTFDINVPLTLASALGAALWFDRSGQRRTTGRMPLLAAGLGTGTVVALVVGLSLGPEHAPGLGCVGLALIGFGLFVRNERRSSGALRVGDGRRSSGVLSVGDERRSGAVLGVGSEQRAGAVLIEPVLRRVWLLRVGAVATALYMASVGSEFYLLTLLWQVMKGYPPLRAGLAFLPLALLVTVGSGAAGRLVRRWGAPWVLAGGFALATAGLALISVTLSGGSYLVDLLPGLLLSGFGHGAIYTSMFVIGTHDVPESHQGTAGALLTTAQYLAGAFTIAVLTLVLGTHPDYVGFRVAFWLTALAALAGAALALRAGRSNASGRRPRTPRIGRPRPDRSRSPDASPA